MRALARDHKSIVEVLLKSTARCDQRSDASPRIILYISPIVPGDFVDRAQQAIDEILSRGRVPVVVGGTMMYVQWLVHGKPDAPKRVR